MDKAVYDYHFDKLKKYKSLNGKLEEVIRVKKKLEENGQLETDFLSIKFESDEAIANMLMAFQQEINVLERQIEAI